MAKKPKKRPQNRAAEARRRDGTFPRGVSGNPGGRPREERELVAALRLSGLDLAKKLIALGLKGNVKAIEVAFNRAYGKAKQVVELSDPDGAAGRIRWDLSRLSTEHVRQLLIIQQIATGELPSEGGNHPSAAATWPQPIPQPWDDAPELPEGTPP